MNRRRDTTGWVNPVDRALEACRSSVRGTYQRLSRRARRVFWVGLVTPLLVVISSGVAYAGDGMGAPAALSWIQVKDSRDTLIWQYELSLDRGGVTNPGKLIWSFFVEIFWGFYQCLVAISVWLVDWVLQFGWLDLIAGPVTEVGDAMSNLIDTLGAGGTFLTLTAAAGAWLMIRGKFSTGIFEIAMACLIAALSLGILADPVRDVVEDGGVLTDSRDAGLVIASSLQNDGAASPGSAEDLRGELTASMTDTFIRGPFQMVNFGKMIDGGDCEDVLQDTLRGGPYGGGDELRNAVKDCDEDAGKIAENPNLGMATSAGALVPAGGIALLFTIVLAGVVLVAGVQAAYQSLRMVVALLFALLPGGARGSLWRTFADLLISLVTVVFTVIFLAVYVLMIAAVFTGGDEGTLQSFIVVDLMMVVGLIIFWKGRARLQAASERLAQALAKRPGSGPTGLPTRSKLDPTAFYYKARMARGALTSPAGKVALGAGAAGLVVATGGVGALAGLASKKGMGKVGAALARPTAAAAQPADSSTASETTNPAQSPRPGQPGQPPAGTAGVPLDAGPPPAGSGGAQAGQRLRERVAAAHSARGGVGRIISDPTAVAAARIHPDHRTPATALAEAARGNTPDTAPQTATAAASRGGTTPTSGWSSVVVQARRRAPDAPERAGGLHAVTRPHRDVDAAARLRARLQHHRPNGPSGPSGAALPGLAVDRRQ